MTTKRPRLRRQLFEDVSMGEHARDTQRALDAIPLTLLRTVEANFAPMIAVGGATRPPDAVEAIRVVDMASQETPTGAGGACDFVWRPQSGGAQVTGIPGLTVAANGGRRYRFTFRLTFAAGGS